MTETEEFLAATMPRLTEAETALHNGDTAGRIAMWSRTDPLTVFGAALSARGWDEIGPMFGKLGTTFSDCQSYRNEIVAAGASGDLAYIVAARSTPRPRSTGPRRSRSCFAPPRSSAARTASGRSSTGMLTRSPPTSRRNC